MSTTLKQCLGIDVSKHSLSLSFGILGQDLSKHFTPHEDVRNDTEGFKAIATWLEEQLDEQITLIIVMEATGVPCSSLFEKLRTSLQGTEPTGSSTGYSVLNRFSA